MVPTLLVGLFHCKFQSKMDDDWGYPHLWKPQYLYIYIYIIDIYCLSLTLDDRPLLHLVPSNPCLRYGLHPALLKTRQVGTSRKKMEVSKGSSSIHGKFSSHVWLLEGNYFMLFLHFRTWHCLFMAPVLDLMLADGRCRRLGGMHAQNDPMSPY